ncbi:MAG TPA: hypothetical protein PKU74_06910, partial [Candidatus Omnitrophota bacterium]|nr:hypothetical protein [Candidatus Omnitrophota bacterium]
MPSFFSIIPFLKFRAPELRSSFLFFSGGDMNTQPLQRGSQDPITKRRWALVLMMAGVGLRLAYFFQNPPLWLDEINVTLPALHVPFRAFLSGGFAHSTVPIKPALFNIILKA